MVHGNLFEIPGKILNKTMKNGKPNPRFTTAVNEAKEQRIKLKELVGNFQVFSKARIAREYTPERVAALLAAAQRNLQAMRGPSIRPAWMPEE